MYEKYVDLKTKKGVTDYEVAKQTGISTTTFTHWKHGRYTPKMDKLLLIAKYFGVSLEYFVDGTK